MNLEIRELKSFEETYKEIKAHFAKLEKEGWTWERGRAIPPPGHPARGMIIIDPITTLDNPDAGKSQLTQEQLERFKEACKRIKFRIS